MMNLLLVVPTHERRISFLVPRKVLFSLLFVKQFGTVVIINADEDLFDLVICLDIVKILNIVKCKRIFVVSDLNFTVI